MANRKLVLICDLDNTLYDWVGYFVPALYALVEQAAQFLDVSEEQLLNELREVHRRHSDSEHPFALLETESVLKKFGAGNGAIAYRELNAAFHAFNRTRKRELRLFPDAMHVLRVIKQSGIKILAHTESRFYAAADRVHRLGLADAFERIYCRLETATVHPDTASAREWLRSRELSRFIRLPADDLKPNPRVLHDICIAESVDVGNVVYLGDSIAKDMMMAKKAGAIAVWAKYGANHDPAMYSRLVKVSHWTAADVEREARLRAEASAINPDYVCEKSIRDLLSFFSIIESETGTIGSFA